MDRKILLTAITFSFMLLSCGKGKLNYPESATVDVVDEYFGVEVTDPYRWLEDDNSEETKQWVKAQNELTQEYLGKIEFRDKIRQRLDELSDYERISFLDQKGDKYFYYKNSGLQAHNVLYVKDGKEGAERIVIDPNTLSDDGTKSLIEVELSNDGKYLAYAVSESGSDWRELFIVNTETGEQFPEVLKDVRYTKISWYKEGFYYSKYNAVDEEERLTAKNAKSAVYYHQLNTSQSEDELVFKNDEYNDAIYYTYVSGKYLVIKEQRGTYGNQLYLKNVSEKNKNIFRLTTGFNYEYEVVASIGDKIYMLTDFRSPRFRLVEVDLNTRSIGEWKDIIPEAKAKLDNVELIAGKLVAVYLDDIQHKIELFEPDGTHTGSIELPGAGTVTGIAGNKNGVSVFYGFTSYLNPESVYEYNISTKETEVFFAPEIKTNISGLEAELQFYESKDGTKIPLYMVHQSGVKKDGNTPTLLYGYGGFNHTIMPYYDPKIVLWAEMGGLYANAHIRGGGEYGEVWHQKGVKKNKQNVFDDFIAAAEYLQNEKYTSPEKTAIMGRSNGGLLVGAVTNQRPDLFAVAIPMVGVMDMLRYHKFTIGWAWASDYGSVEEDSASFANLYAYSPLHNISEQKDYPAIMVTTADHDDRVVPAHSFKYAATLQNNTTDDSPKLIRIQTDAGHGAGVPLMVKNQEIADVYSFTLLNLGESY